MFNLISADGYFETGDHDITWHNVDAEFNDELATPMLEQAGTLIFGKRTYELMASYWPTEAGMRDDPVVAAKMNELDKLVFSHSLQHADWQHTTVLHSIDQLKKLKQAAGKPFIILGSSNLCVSLLQQGLIDELRILVNPVVLGAGIPLFAGLAEPLRLQLQDTKPFKSGNVLLTYAVRKTS